MFNLLKVRNPAILWKYTLLLLCITKYSMQVHITEIGVPFDVWFASFEYKFPSQHVLRAFS